MLEKKTIDAIRAPFPEEAVQVKKSFKNNDGSQSYLTGYKPQYIIERLNDTFGHESWDFEVTNFGNEGKEYWVLGRITVYATKVDPDALDGPLIRKVMTVKEQFGNQKKNSAMDLGDVLKGAATNAMEKCASLLDVGHEAYKGLVPVPKEQASYSKATETKEDDGLTKAKNNLRDQCKKCKINKESLKALVNNVLKEEKEVATLDVEEINKLVSHLEKNGSPF